MILMIGLLVLCAGLCYRELRLMNRQLKELDLSITQVTSRLSARQSSIAHRSERGGISRADVARAKVDQRYDVPSTGRQKGGLKFREVGGEDEG